MLHGQHVLRVLTDFSWHMVGKHRGRDLSPAPAMAAARKGQLLAIPRHHSTADWHGVFMHTHSFQWDRQGARRCGSSIPTPGNEEVTIFENMGSLSCYTDGGFTLWTKHSLS